MPDFKPIRELRGVDAARFRAEILPSGQPAVIRGAVSDWPVTRAGRDSPRAVANYLRAFDNGASLDAMTADPSIGGRFFYDDALTARNFQNQRMRLGEALDRLIALLEEPEPPALYLGAVPAPAALPGFNAQNSLPLLDANVVPRIWIGNRVTVQTHYDLSFNVACVTAGRRRFTLFPPEQLVNLYVGPLEFTLAGQPISMARIEAPDFERYPKFRDALASAVSAELEPGDAIFVPYMWWHHVESLDAFNVLVNYWWDDAPPWSGSAFEVLLHGILSIRNLPAERRELWRKIFDHYVFKTGADSVAHLTEKQQGIQGPPSPRLAALIRNYLIESLSRRR